MRSQHQQSVRAQGRSAHGSCAARRALTPKPACLVKEPHRRYGESMACAAPMWCLKQKRKAHCQGKKTCQAMRPHGAQLTERRYCDPALVGL